MNNVAIGVDIENISRFEGKSLENDSKFFDLIYTQKELEYCFSKSVPYQHLAARFCAKEAVVKALANFDITDVLYCDIEILNKDSGCPYVIVQKYPNYKYRISLSHTKDMAIANAVIFE